MQTHLLVDFSDDNDIVEHLFLMSTLRDRLTDREHAVLAMRMSGYTRMAVVNLLGIGKTTVYTCERSAMQKIKTAYRLQDERDTWKDNMDTTALSAEKA